MKYLPNSGENFRKMLEEIGVKKIEDLFQSIPEEVRLKRPLDLPAGKSEIEVMNELGALASKNISAECCPSFLGAGAYRHYIPSVVANLISRSEFYTAYTPYQPEVSQGTLQALFEYQTMICQLTGMDIANASLYDGASAAAEAVLMADRIQRKRKKIVLSAGLHPEYIETIETYLHNLPFDIVKSPLAPDGTTDLDALKKSVDAETAAVLFQSPNFFGAVEKLDSVKEIVASAGALFITAVSEIYSLGLLNGPGAYGADIVIGEAQSFGNRLNYGGPFLGFVACKDEYKRQLPGRLIGMTSDNRGQTGFVITLSTREQHIRREKATSNICTNEALCATMAAIHMCTMGEEGIKEAALQCMKKAAYAKEQLKKNHKIKFPHDAPVFNEFVIDIGKNGREVVEKIAKNGVIAGFPLVYYYPERENQILLAFTEVNSKQDIDRLVSELGGEL